MSAVAFLGRPDTSIQDHGDPRHGQPSTADGLPTALTWVVIAAADVVFAKVRRQPGSGK